jgi:hypothetical protein
MSGRSVKGVFISVQAAWVKVLCCFYRINGEALGLMN